MRSMWTGVISWGIISVPIKLFKATEDHDIESHMAHAHDHGRIRMPRICQECGEVVSQADIVKMYETESGPVYVTDAELSELSEAEKYRKLEILEWVSPGDIDPMMYEESYFVGPNQKEAAQPYALLAAALAQTERVAVARLTMRTKTHLAVLRVIEKGNVLMVQTLRWPDEVRAVEFSTADDKALTRARSEVKDAELKMTVSLIESASNEWNPDRYQDTYRAELAELIESKMDPVDDSEEVVETPEVLEEVGDLLAKLEDSKAKKRTKATSKRKVVA